MGWRSPHKEIINPLNYANKNHLTILLFHKTDNHQQNQYKLKQPLIFWFFLMNLLIDCYFLTTFIAHEEEKKMDEIILPRLERNEANKN